MALRPLVLLIAALAAHCVGSDAMYDPPGGKGFWARRSDLTTGSTTFYRSTAMFVSASAHANVYVDTKSSVSQSAVDGLVAAFENNIVPIEHVWYTTPTDVDNNGKVIFLLLDIQDGYREGSSTGYIAGYFDPLNLYSDTSVNALNSQYHSNEAEMLYLDTYPADVTRTSFLATLAHEYQHLLQFGKYYRGDQNDIEPTWIDEGLSEVSSDLTGYGPQVSRATTFRSSLINSTSLIREPAQFGLENYATSYIYFRYLADVYGLGGIASIFNDNQVGLTAVNSALQRLDSGLTGVCGTTAGLAMPYFGCSYRFMWGALIEGNLGDSPTGAIVRYNGTADSALGAGTIDYRMKTQTSQYSQELANSLLNGSYDALSSRTTGALQSYAPLLGKIKSGGSPPSFQTCTNCGLTIIQGTNYYVVFNHDSNTSSTHSATIVDSLQSLSGDTGATTPAPALPEPVANLPIEHRAMHWHFPLTAEQLSALR